MKKLLCLFLCIALMCPAITVFAGEEITVYINGAQVKLDNKPRRQDDTVMLPVKELLERIGIFVSFDEYDRRSVIKKGYIAEVNGAEMIAPPDSPEACYDEVWFELDTPTVGVQGDVLVPMEFVNYFYGVDVTLNDNVLRISNKYEGTLNTEELGDSALLELLATIPRGDVIVSDEDLINSEVRNGENNGIFTKKILSNEDKSMGFSQLVELETLTQARYTYDAQLQIPVKSKIEKGDFLVLSFWARMLNTTDESGFASVGPTVEEYAKGSFVAALDQTSKASVTSEWKKFYFPFSGVDNWDAGVWRLCLRVGYKPQTVQIAGLDITNYHKTVNVTDVNTTKKAVDTYYGREEGALWREEALKRIEKYRIRDINVSVVDESGAPVPDADIKAEMTRSEFLWGSIGPIAYADRLGANLREYMKSHLNAITPENSMKRSNYANNGGATAVEHANFAVENNMYLHGHVLFWDRWSMWPDIPNAENMSEEELREYFYAWTSELMAYFGDTMTQLDVVNEPRANRSIREKFGVDFVADIFRLSGLMRDEYAPDLKLYLNETSIAGQAAAWDYVYRLDALMKELISEGAPIDGIGHQLHTDPNRYPQTVYNQLDYSADLVKELTVTEYDAVHSGSGLNNQEKLELESDYLRDMLIMTYSNPKMAGFIMWGIYDYQHWRGDSPILDREYNEKPGAAWWNKLVLDEWKTKTGGVTDENGACAMRGHRGEYDITVSVGGKTAKTTLKVSEDGKNHVTATVHTDGSISLNSSEEVVLKKIARKDIKELELNRTALRDVYKKYMENSIIRAMTDDGKDASMIFDGSEDSYWASHKAGDAVICEMEEVCNGGRMTIQWSKNGRQNLYKVETSSDGENWEMLKSGIGVGTEEIRVKTQQVKYIRISSLTGLGISMSEVSFSKL